MEKVTHKSPHDTLIDALEKVERMGKVLVIWESPDKGTCGQLDSDLSIQEALYMVSLYQHWLLNQCLGKD